MALNSSELKKLQETLKEQEATWEAGATSINKLSPEERRRRLGCIPEDRPNQEKGEKSIRESGETAPPKSDWTNVNGSDYVDPVEDQGDCGSCVGFAITSTLEITLRWLTKLPYNGADGYLLSRLSPADVYYCGGSGNCTDGMSISTGLDYSTKTGVVPWSCYPYKAKSPNPPSCAINNNVRTQSFPYSYYTDKESMKLWLSSKGALVASFDVYEDFYSYKSGVYKPTSTTQDGSHAVCVVGYDDNIQAWKCKNSWGTDWGQSGYFWIAYGVCNIDDFMYAVDGFTRFYSYPGLSLGDSHKHDQGASPSVALSNTASVEVHQSHWEFALWYRKGDTTGNFQDSHKYDKGWGPVVSLNNHGVAVEVHKSQSASTLWYHVGQISGNEVNWGDSHKYDTGLHPGVAVNDGGVVVEVHQGSGQTKLYYRVGFVNGSSIDFGDSHEFDNGLHPRVAINNHNQVVAIHQSENTATIWHHVGTIDLSSKTIAWGSSHKIDSGYYPSVALDDWGRVIEVHQSEATISLWYHTGNIIKDELRVDWIRESQKYDTGYYPMIAMNNSLQAIEIHQSETELRTWYHSGTLKVVALATEEKVESYVESM